MSERLLSFYYGFRSPNNEAFFYSDNNFNTVTSRLSLAKLSAFSMSPVAVTAGKIHHVVAFVPCESVDSYTSGFLSGKPPQPCFRYFLSDCFAPPPSPCLRDGFNTHELG